MPEIQPENISMNTGKSFEMEQSPNRSLQSVIQSKPEIIHYKDPLEQLNSKLKVAWSKSLDATELPSSTKYKRVHVLMLSWEQQHDDLKVHGEVRDLRAVFEQDYHFHVTEACLQRKERRKTQTQINRIVAEWVDTYDAPKTLLIVYFAGHGRPSKRNPDNLELAGQLVASDGIEGLDRVVWNHTECLLHDICSDVLQIFDCCYAGTIGARGERLSALEFLAAAGPDKTTRKPGDQSFTSALIWALKQLASDSERFTTTQLSNMITAAPNFPRDEQEPMLSKRNDNPNVIMIQPLSLSQSPPEPTDSPQQGSEDDISEHHVVPLKLVWESKPSEEHVSKLAKAIFNVIQYNGMPVSKATLGDVKLKQEAVMRKYVKRWRSISDQLRKQAAVSALNTAPSAPESPSSPDNILLSPDNILSRRSSLHAQIVPSSLALKEAMYKLERRESNQGECTTSVDCTCHIHCKGIEEIAIHATSSTTVTPQSTAISHEPTVPEIIVGQGS